MQQEKCILLILFQFLGFFFFSFYLIFRIFAIFLWGPARNTFLVKQYTFQKN